MVLDSFIVIMLCYMINLWVRARFTDTRVFGGERNGEKMLKRGAKGGGGVDVGGDERERGGEGAGRR
ncbi:hypothetical protein LguiB_011698 [Lonicera macranthoides]